MARLTLALVLVLSVHANAQRPVPRGESPTAGVAVPAGPVAGGGEATAVELNPASLPFMGAWNLMYLHTELDGDGVRGGRGDAFYAATPLPFLRSLAVGAALQSVRPPASFPFHDLTKLSFALAWRPLAALGLGLGYAHVFPGDTPGMGAIDTFDLGVDGRLGRWLALGLVAHDLFQPGFRGLGAQRVYEPELAVRPLGSERLEIALAARIGERRGDVDPRARVSVSPAPGLFLRGALELRRDIDGDRHPENDLRATVGLELDLARFGVGGYALFGGAAGGSNFHGWAATARLSGDRYETVIARRRLEKVELRGTKSDRATAALLTHLRRLEKDRSCAGVVVVAGPLDGAWATMEDLRGALERLRAAGKRVFAYGAEMNTKGYYVASAAEKIWLDPSGGVRLVGLASSSLYFRGSFDKLGVQADFVRIAEYKSAPEQYTRTGPTPEAERARNAMLDDIYGRLVERMAVGRKMAPAEMRATIDRGPFTGAEAVRAKLVDDLRHGDEIEGAIAETMGRSVVIAPGDKAPKHPSSWSTPCVAVVFVEGDIVDGKSQTIPILNLKLVGHETLLRAIEEARSDPAVRALVLRIDSPGGSALASDLVSREITRTRQVKPVVCSLGDVAASGGYFIAASCDFIIAEPSTVTGSIGIFTGKFDLSGLGQKLGVNVTGYKRGAYADMESFWRPYTEDERTRLLEKLRYYYDRFVGTVAAGRGLKPAEVDAIGRGRVWTGAQARERKLVDQLGGFMDAVAEAKKRAGLGEWAPVDLKGYPDEPTTLLGQLARLLGLKADAMSLAEVSDLLRSLPGSLVHSPSTPQARMEEAILW